MLMKVWCTNLHKGKLKDRIELEMVAVVRAYRPGSPVSLSDAATVEHGGIEDRVSQESNWVHDSKVHREALHGLSSVIVEDLGVEGCTPCCKVDPAHDLNAPTDLGLPGFV